MRPVRLFGALILIFFICSSAHAELEYVRSMHGNGGDKPARGTLNQVLRDHETYVSMRQFCFALGCRVFYQWAQYRAIVQNPSERLGGIVSSLTHVALVDGKVLEFEGQVLSDPKEGYLLPVDLAKKLSLALFLGHIEQKETPIVKKEPLGAPYTLQTLVLDPGHGGSDLGTGAGSIYEKDVSLIYALRLREELRRQMPGLEVILTRDDDHYVSLPDRAKLANAKGAGLFLSLHVNHAPDSKAEGAETYILSPDATDDEAKKLALLENDTWLKTSKIKGAGNMVTKILVDMEQTKYIQKSALAAAIIQQEFGGLEKTYGLHRRGVKQAMFYVLSQVAMPSTLVEMGFLSNTGDRGRLMDVVFRDEFVKSLASALKRYQEVSK